MGEACWIFPGIIFKSLWPPIIVIFTCNSLQCSCFGKLNQLVWPLKILVLEEGLAAVGLIGNHFARPCTRCSLSLSHGKVGWVGGEWRMERRGLELNLLSPFHWNEWVCFNFTQWDKKQPGLEISLNFVPHPTPNKTAMQLRIRVNQCHAYLWLSSLPLGNSIPIFFQQFVLFVQVPLFPVEQYLSNQCQQRSVPHAKLLAVSF